MADTKALSGLPADHWIHKALAKTKKGGKKTDAAPTKAPAVVSTPTFTQGPPAC